jgi:hypothetical protein
MAQELLGDDAGNSTQPGSATGGHRAGRLKGACAAAVRPRAVPGARGNLRHASSLYKTPSPAYIHLIIESR